MQHAAATDARASLTLTVLTLIAVYSIATPYLLPEIAQAGTSGDHPHDAQVTGDNFAYHVGRVDISNTVRCKTHHAAHPKIACEEHLLADTSRFQLDRASNFQSRALLAHLRLVRRFDSAPAG